MWLRRSTIDWSLDHVARYGHGEGRYNAAINKMSPGRRTFVDPARRRNAKRGFFRGLNAEETADLPRVSPITVTREWKCARAWLYRELAGPVANGR